MNRAFWTYVISLGLFAATLFVVLKIGSAGHEVQYTAGRGIAERLSDGLKDPVGQVLMQILVIVAVAQAFGAVFKWFKQPSVIGEMFAGIALGPSVLGAVSPETMKFVFPQSGLGGLSVLSQLGILLFMFVVGLDLDFSMFKKRAHAALVISHVSIVVPFAFGALAALWLYNSFGVEGSTFLPFALFMGISLSITAFPVLARILQERKMAGSEIGTIVLACAAIDDVTAWCGLAVIVALARAHTPYGALTTIFLTVLFVMAAFYIVKPLLASMAAKEEDKAVPSNKSITIAVLTAFAMACTTQVIGAHAFFGAFLAGVVIPRSGPLAEALHTRLFTLSSIILLPVFFAFTGLRTQLGLLHNATDWLVCGGVLLLAVSSKFGASTIAGRVMGLPWKQALGVGVMMNTRGLVELIALNLGLDLGVLSPRMFSILVVMALATTFMTGPALSLLRLDKESTKEALATPEPAH